MKTLFIFFLSALLTANSSLAGDITPSDVLTVDSAVPSMMKFPFATDDDQQPKNSDFIVVNQILMSNDRGERWVTVTLKNKSSGQRIFSPQQMLAVFANGEKRTPAAADITMSGGEIMTYTLYFGTSKFPVLYIYTKN